jgi:hypothetical protein
VAPTIEQLEAMSDDEIKALYNDVAQHTVVGLSWYGEELHRRAAARETLALLRLTWILASLTLVNVVLVAVTAFA